MDETIQYMIFLLIILLISILVKSTHIKPYSFLLIIVGIIIGLLKNKLNNTNYDNSLDFWINMHPQDFLFYFIPPLIYESCCNIDFHIFRRTFWLIISITFTGVVLTCGLTCLFLFSIEPSYNILYSLLLATILSATDPVAVISNLSELNISNKLTVVIEGESLLNDGITIALFDIIFHSIHNPLSRKEIILDSIRLSIGGLAIGIVVTTIKLFFLRKIYNDVVSEKLLTFISCYAIYYIAEYTPLHTSGIIGLVISGLMMASFGKTSISPNVQQSIQDFWRLLSNISNVVIFILSGIIIACKISFTDISINNWLNMIYLYFFLNFVRFIAISLLYPFIRKNTYKYDIVDFVIISLSGLRGEISLALALYVNLEESIDINIRNTILFYTAGIVFFSILINSLAIKYIIKIYHKDRIQLDNDLLVEYKNHINKQAYTYLDELEKMEFHMKKVNLPQIKCDMMNNLKQVDIDSTSDKSTSLKARQLFLYSFKKNIWILFEEHLLHYDIVMKLIEIVDQSCDHEELEWGYYMNEYCNKEHIDTFDIKLLNCFQKYLHCICRFKNYLLHNKIEYSYNLIQGYILSQKRTLEKINEIIDDEDLLQIILSESKKSLVIPHQYITHLEETYEDILIEVETQQVSLLIIARQQTYLEYLKKNGEISENVYDKLFHQLQKREYLLK